MEAYSENFITTLVKIALLKPEISPRNIAKEAGVSGSALYNWIKSYKSAANQKTAAWNRCDDWTSEERFTMLLEAGQLSEEQQGAYCRRKGIYQHQLSEWKKEFMTQKSETKKTKEASELKRLRAENKALKKDLRRKEKALAEASALLILKKKANLLWGEPEED